MGLPGSVISQQLSQFGTGANTEDDANGFQAESFTYKNPNTKQNELIIVGAPPGLIQLPTQDCPISKPAKSSTDNDLRKVRLGQ